MNEQRTIAIIQARMGSSRLPGKVMMALEGKPVLWHVIERVKQARSIDDVVIATTIEAQDDQLEAFCTSIGIAVFRGVNEMCLTDTTKRQGALGRRLLCVLRRIAH